ncbi:Glutaminyl-peptide cyclotransferase-like [Homarus americanus]|uniref:glutaminyl-peptide cyclotransferase n=1 Tax=Homarus americanus TaxID=6706 RepID=A0A8J5JHB2_HOMAM|nr:Glutaminyl-peptide cyclotransferase-like [Homarus americanus]
MKHFKSVLDPILVPRIVGSTNHANVRKHLVNTMHDLSWTVEEDTFLSNTPFGKKNFTNVIATLDPGATRRLVLACHYDSKIHREGAFVGATDSAVPCAMMLNLATVMQTSLNQHNQTCLKKKTKEIHKKKRPKVQSRKGKRGCTKKELKKLLKKFKGKSRSKKRHNNFFLGLHRVHRDNVNKTQVRRNVQRSSLTVSDTTSLPRQPLRSYGKIKCCTASGSKYKLIFVPTVRSDLTLQFLFLDGEEAFREWSEKDSLYGARDLAAKMKNRPYPDVNIDNTNELHRIDLFVLLDLLGTKDVQFSSYFKNTDRWYARLISFERRMNDLQLLHRRQFIFRKHTAHTYSIEDDHIPFLRRGVPVLHLIPTPFPTVWHNLSDNERSLHYPTIENLNKILYAFVADYLHLLI